MRVKQFVITGKPTGKGRPRLGRGHTYTPPKTAAYENWVKLSYNLQVEDKAPLTGAIKADVTAYFAPPRSATRTEKRKMLDGSLRPTKKPDIDNILKIVFDSLNGIAYKDDAAIVTVTCRKKYTSEENEEDRVEVTLIGD